MEKGFKDKWKQWYSGLFSSERKSGVGKRSKILYFLIFIIILFGILCGKEKYLEWKETHSGIPDVLSSMNVANEQYLVMVANSSCIDDREAFAREVIHMYQENAFHSVRFSMDLCEYPSKVDITVYLNKDEVDKGKPVCEIEFYTDDYENSDMKNNVDSFHLFLDGKEIEFY